MSCRGYVLNFESLSLKLTGIEVINWIPAIVSGWAWCLEPIFDQEEKNLPALLYWVPCLFLKMFRDLSTKREKKLCSLLRDALFFIPFALIVHDFMGLFIKLRNWVNEMRKNFLNFLGTKPSFLLKKINLKPENYLSNPFPSCFLPVELNNKARC